MATDTSRARISARASRWHFAAFSRRRRPVALSMNVALFAPRERASRPMAPVPAKMSRTRVSKRPKLASTLKMLSRVRPKVGLVARPAGAERTVPLALPPMILSMDSTYVLYHSLKYLQLFEKSLGEGTACSAFYRYPLTVDRLSHLMSHGGFHARFTVNGKRTVALGSISNSVTNSIHFREDALPFLLFWRGSSSARWLRLPCNLRE